MIAMKWKAVRGSHGGMIWRWVKVVIPAEKVLDITSTDVKINTMPG